MFVSAYSSQYSSYSMTAVSRTLANDADSDSGKSQSLSGLGAQVTISQSSYTLLQASTGFSNNEVEAPKDSTDVESSAVNAIPGASDRIASAAGTIVGFIAQRLAQDVADGATQEELQSRLQAGLEGFLSGYGDAAAQLEGLGQLNPDIAAEIEGTFDKVIEGIGALSEQYLEDSYRLDLSSYESDKVTNTAESVQSGSVSTVPAAVAPPSTLLTYDQKTLKAQAQLNALSSLQVVEDVQRQVAEKAAQKSANENDSILGDRKQTNASINGAKTLSDSSIWAKFSYQELQARSFSFNLTTEEGDVVTINASAASGYGAQANYQNSNGSYLKYQEASVQTSQFSFSVDGDLSDEELAAINDLLGEVNDLAAVFYQGDVQGAFEQALSLGYDEDQIAAFSLSLTQTTVQRATQEYQRNDAEHQPVAKRLLPVGQFMGSLQSVLERIEKHVGQTELLSTLLDQSAAPYEEKSRSDDNGAKDTSALRSFVERLLDKSEAAA